MIAQESPELYREVLLPDGTTYPDYREKLAEQNILWGDQYALTMSQALFTNGKHDTPATFHAYIRKAPFNGTYLLTAGQNIVFEWLQNWHFGERELGWMRRQTVADAETGEKHPLFTEEFIEECRGAKLELTVDAMPEGELAFPDEPIYRVHGPIWQCLMVEAAILNAINSQSLFATLASRLVEIADGAPIMALGLRRAQCIGGLEPARAAYIAGITGTSNMQAGEFYGIPSSGTMAHAFIMAYEEELDAFLEYAGAMPYNGIFLVDTYDTLEGVKKAAKACQEKGIKLKGIRLDSGDLAYLSIEARKILDEAGFTGAKIVASNDLDEETIQSLKQQGAKIDIWGIGTNLETSKAQPALGAVYKLGAIYDQSLELAEIEAMRILIKQGRSPRDPNFARDVIKMSADHIKVTVPGELDVLRYVVTENGKPVRFDGDTIISNLSLDPVDHNGRLSQDIVSILKVDDTQSKRFHKGVQAYHPLNRIYEGGQLISSIETVHDARKRAAHSMAMLDKSHRRLQNPHTYVVGIEESLSDHRKSMMRHLRQKHYMPRAELFPTN